MFGIMNRMDGSFAHLPLPRLLLMLEKDGIFPPAEAIDKMGKLEAGKYFHIHHYTIFASSGGVSLTD